ncbi:MAG: hypothetical protein ACSHX6_07640 [Akkermansiaceae bacterium]
MFRKLLEILMIYSLCSVLGMSAELTFEKKLKEVTTKPDVEVVNIEFDFVNNTDEVIKIVNYDAPCSCMEARLNRADKKNSLVFAPGDKGTLIGMLEFGTFSGTIDKVIKVRTDKDVGDEPSIILTSRVTIPKLIATDKETLVWQVGDKLEAKEFSIKVDAESATPIKVVEHKYGFGTDEMFDYKMETMKEGREYKVTVTPLKTDAPTMGVVKFYTDSTIARYKMVQIFLLVDHPKK